MHVYSIRIKCKLHEPCTLMLTYFLMSVFHTSKTHTPLSCTRNCFLNVNSTRPSFEVWAHWQDPKFLTHVVCVSRSLQEELLSCPSLNTYSLISSVMLLTWKIISDVRPSRNVCSSFCMSNERHSPEKISSFSFKTSITTFFHAQTRFHDLT